VFLAQLYGRELFDHDPAHSLIATTGKIEFEPIYIGEFVSEDNTINLAVCLLPCL